MRFSSLTLFLLGYHHGANAKGIQSGSNAGPMYSSSLAYDENQQLVYLTGITYDQDFQGGGSTKTEQPMCFVSSLELSNNGFSNFKQGKTFGSPENFETCISSALVDKHSSLVVTGTSKKGGLYASASTKLSAFGMALDKNDLSVIDGVLLDTDPIRYPVAIVSRGDDVYIAAYTATDEATASNLPSRDSPNWLLYQEFGTSLELSVMKMSLSQNELDGIPEGPTEFSSDWVKNLPIDPENDGTVPRVYIGGMILKGDDLIVAGSTRGLGEGYGNAAGDDEDGFLTILDPVTGKLKPGVKDNERIGSAKDDVVSGICHDPNDPDHFYIVGATKGDLGGIKASDVDIVDGSLQAFIMKMKLADLHAAWTVTFGAQNGQSKTAGYALGCAVTDDIVYIGGTVESGASMIHGSDVKSSNGKDDVWVAQLNQESAQILWMQQIGTPEKDIMSRAGGIIADVNGNAVVLGDTYGSLFRERSEESNDSSNVFVVSLDKADGNYEGGAAAPVAPPVTVTEVTDSPTPPPVAAPVLPPHQQNVYNGLGFQKTGPLYAGGMVYDDEAQQVILTGGTYTSGGLVSKCFVSVVNIKDGSIAHTDSLGSADIPASCSAVTYDPKEDIAYALGGTEANGIFYEMVSNEESVQLGLLAQVDVRHSELIGGGVNDDDTVQYPVAVATQKGDNEHVYAVFMGSDDDAVVHASVDDPARNPDLTSGGVRKYGSDFFLIVKRYRVEVSHDHPDPPPHSVHTDWYKDYQLDVGSVEPSGMAFAGDGSTLVVVGNTKFSGGVFGEKGGDDMDGWVIKLDPETGETVNGDGGKASTRVDSANHKDDWVTGVCADPFDQDAVYLVGKTQGKIRGLSDDQQLPEGSTHAFVARIHIHTLGVTWSKHFTMSSPEPNESAEAYGCVVSPEDDGKSLVYVAGVVESGAVMDDCKEGKSGGKDDIFVAQLKGISGDINWIRQVGSSEDDRLATGGAIDLDADGNAIIFGETKGSFYAAADKGKSDLVLFTMGKVDGEYLPLGARDGGVVVKPNDRPPMDDDDVIPGYTPPGPDDFTGDDDVDPGYFPQDHPDYEPVPDNIVAIQSGPDVGPSYAGGMTYDKFTNALYVTGATYGAFDGPGIDAKQKSSCFFGILRLPKLRWQERETYGTPTTSDACNALALMSYLGKKTAIVVGSTEAGGLMTQMAESANEDKQYGMALDLSTIDGGYELLGGALMEESKVQYPIAVVSEGDKVWTVSMSSQDTKVTPDFEQVKNNEYPNLTTGGVEKYGSAYSIVIEQRTLSRSTGQGTDVIQETLKQDWRKPFETADLESVFVSGLIQVGTGSDKVLVGVGSTRSQGGQKSDDMDGLMFKLNPLDGSFMDQSQGGKSVAYFSSVTGRDDWILNNCPDPDDPSVFYVVGGTKGVLDKNTDRKNKDATVHAVVARIHTESLTASWTKQFLVTGPTGNHKKPAAAVALGCDVISGSKLMYIAGNVENGAAIKGDTTQVSAGNDDIFVAQLSTEDGSLKWMRQIGSRGDDRVARGGGVKADANGNAVVFGDTNGSLFRDRNKAEYEDQFSDVFALVLRKEDGRSQDPVTPAAHHRPQEDHSAPNEWFSDLKKVDPKSLAFGIVVLIFLVIAGVTLMVCRRNRRYQADAQKTSIFAYLQRFEVDDIDLRKSPPGGWHGTYLNKLAYGINKAETSGQLAEFHDAPAFETARLTHSSVVTDSLFMDTASKPSLGYQDDPNGDGSGFEPKEFTIC